MLKLYHYVHCPFCIRVRMALGYLKLNYESVVLPYDDEKTPIELMGVKMLPIMQFENGEHSNESLDIIQRLDHDNKLNSQQTRSDSSFSEFENLLDTLGKTIHNLAMPYFIYTPEFNQSSREYFQRKKEAKRGPFKNLVKNSAADMKKIYHELDTIPFRPFFKNDHFSLKDIMFASHCWGLYIVPEFQFPPKVHQYLQWVKELCSFDYHEDYWR